MDREVDMARALPPSRGRMVLYRDKGNCPSDDMKKVPPQHAAKLPAKAVTRMGLIPASPQAIMQPRVQNNRAVTFEQIIRFGLFHPNLIEATYRAFRAKLSPVLYSAQAMRQQQQHAKQGNKSEPLSRMKSMQRSQMVSSMHLNSLASRLGTRLGRVLKLLLEALEKRVGNSFDPSHTTVKLQLQHSL
ncbi:unnamed protein product [Dovyalis caffra]|uniref:Uncharacterized protein n=1 Tax=Dovyalis caffra TaxID=77055 RepID=A0AAV1R1V7_9ROSI|nr:unnamed protein product [Dovyalis caffra]